MVKICFTAIFKNESKNVNRCLDSVKSIIDYICITDTGSTDDTVKLIYKWGKENSIPTKVHFHTFKNFGYNRTLSVEMAKKSFPAADYCLLIDADMIVNVEKKWNKKILNDDYYLVKQKNVLIEYWNTRLVKTKFTWKCIGVTHEFWRSEEKSSQSQLSGIWIDDKEDGGCKDDKFERDKRLLLEGMEDKSTPKDIKERYMFYLGQTYRDLGDNARSIHWYTKRIEAGGWDEELFFSKLQIGVCYERMGSPERAAGSYLESWEINPHRAESLYHLAKMYRKQGKNNLGLLFAEKGKEIPYPTNNKLFVDHRVYSYLFDEEISICAYYIEGKKKVGKFSIEKLCAIKHLLPPDVISLAKMNSEFYDVEWN